MTQSNLPKISAPATRALNNIGITTLSEVAKKTEKELLELHGFGPKAIGILKEAGVVFSSKTHTQK
jgi:hypothetical protein